MRRILFMTLVSLLLSGCRAASTIATISSAFSWKTPHITAEPYTNKRGDYGLLFKLDVSGYDFDRAEPENYLSFCEGYRYSSGTLTTRIFVAFDDVKNEEQAKKKWREIAPGFEDVIANLSDGWYLQKKQQAREDAYYVLHPEKKWPNTTAPDKTDPYWEFNNNINSNGTQYMKAEVSPGRWQWVIDERAMKALADSENHQAELARALISRVLTDKEMAEVQSYGTSLFTRNMVPYYEDDVRKQYNDALAQQFRLRVIQADKGKP